MGRKSSIDKAVESGDWSSELKKAKAQLRWSGAKIRSQLERSPYYGNDVSHSPPRFGPKQWAKAASELAETKAKTMSLEDMEAALREIGAAQKLSHAQHLAAPDVEFLKDGSVRGTGYLFPRDDSDEIPLLLRGERPVGGVDIKRDSGGVWRQRDFATDLILSRHPKSKIRPGLPPSGAENSKQYAPDGTYLGWLSKAGRPRKSNKLSNAEKQRRYRQRKKLKGQPP